MVQTGTQISQCLGLGIKDDSKAVSHLYDMIMILAHRI